MQTVSTLTAALSLPRLLVVLSLALALLAIPAVSPDDASARRMSERSVSRACANAGGTIYYDFYDSNFESYGMTCTLASGASFTCYSDDVTPFGGILTC
jgi:hypothetical protein